MILRNIFSMSGLNVLKAVASLLVSGTVAGAVSPQEYGLAAFAVPLMALISLITDMGLASAVVREPDLDSHQAGATVSFMAIGGIVGGLLLALSGHWIERAAGLAGLSDVLLGFSAVATLSVCATTPRALLERQLRYGRIAVIEATGMLAGLGSFFVAVYAGWGIGSLVLYHVVLQACRTAGFTMFAWPVFRFDLRFGRVRHIMRIGAWVFASNLLSYAARNVGTLMIGTFLGAAALGVYGLASQFMTTPLMLISWPVSGVLLSTLARMEADTARKAQVVSAVIAATAAITFPLMTFLTFGARYPIERFYGDRWTGLADMVALLAPVGAIQSVAAYNGAILVESGAVRLNFALAVLNGIGLSGIFVLSRWLGLHAMIVTYCASATLVSLTMIYFMCRIGRISLAQLAACVMPGMTASVVALLLAYVSKGLAPETLTDWLEMSGIYLLGVLLTFVGARARLVALLALLVSSNATAAGSEAAERSFDDWVALATANATSPVAAQPGERSITWEAPNGHKVYLGVRNPRPRSGAPTVTLARVPAGADARPYFEDALARVRSEKAAFLLIPPGTYEFQSLGQDRLGHLVIRGLSDVTLKGDEATLRFTQNANGLYLTENSRLKIEGLKIEYTLHTASLGTIQSTPGGNVLTIDPRFPVTRDDAVHYLSEYDPVARNWVKGGQRIQIPPESSTPARYTGNQTYESPAFKRATAGKTFVVFHHWYGGVAIKIADVSPTLQSEDLTFEHVSIYSGPGMGILAYGMKRGLAIVDSTIAPRSDSGSLISTEYDAVHILIAGGDVLIKDNHISGQGDDGINYNNPVHPVVSVGGDGTRITLSMYSRFIRPGDTLAFFDADAGLIGKSTVASVTPKGGLNNEITLDAPVRGIDAEDVARDLNLINSRYVIDGNTIARCQCHGILLQAPFGRVSHNTISDTAFNGIRLLANVGSFKEGVGAFDVIVQNNTISNTGPDSSLNMPWAAISAYGGIRNGQVTVNPVNSDLYILDNQIINVAQGCITVLGGRRVKIAGNTCSAGESGDPTPAITVRNTAGVQLERNGLSGRFTGKMAVEPAPPRDLKIR